MARNGNLTATLEAISDKGVRAALFVCGMRVDEADARSCFPPGIRQATSSAISSYSHSSMERANQLRGLRRRFSEITKKMIAPYTTAPRFSAILS